MKKAYHILSIALLSGFFLVVACENGLEEETFSVYDENVLTKPEHAEQAVRGVYAALKDNGGFGYYAGYLYWLYEYPADVVTTTPTARQGVQIDQLTYDASNSVINNVWTSVFRLISRANEAEELISNVNYIGNASSVTVQNQNLGEVRFLRALGYYDATSLWGDVPLLLKSSSKFTEADENPALVDQAEVEKAMIADLQFAESNLPASYPPAEIARATSGTAKALLVRLYMRRGEWQKAADKALEVMNKNYDLRTTAEGGVVSLYNTSNRSDNEFIFVLKSSNEAGAYGVNSNSFGINSVPWDYNRGWGSFPIHLQFYSAFEKTDARRDLLTGIFKTLYGQVISVPKQYGGLGGAAPDTVAATYIYNLKYPHVNNYNYAGFNNVTILRYADVLMMRAEALNELNGPNQESITLVNQIRTRSKLSELTLGSFTTKAALRDKIFEERGREFFMEGRRRDDLIRWGKSASNGATPLLKFKEKVLPTLRSAATYSDNVDYTVYPYPQNEIQSNTSMDASVNAGRVK
ncbi:RagB/SusD family nutrient uptake outer membrane protein [Dyadobacter psychrotolerans]|uniref:RagB/SusD family nutrient uptake outer membrane protein n=1 Tax=Dyadobacter psychrotolerans TaxID=2541721 RepID=A0A4R5DRI7_9BACT|nr:RagB/SusD family nutrient uptake outer membrane protein [Dyadobacter psychrotolerans]TDE14671.1 RagB/SusD family nutrient uptake outer membrane protein [Dyadobacter psychrotolerans]